MHANMKNLSGIMRIANREFTYHVVYSKRRKTVQIKLLSPLSVQITAPLGYSLLNAEKLLLSKRKWLTAHSIQLEEHSKSPFNRGVEPGESLLYLGRPYLLTVAPGAFPDVALESEQIVVRIPISSESKGHSPQSRRIGALLKSWYGKQAAQVLLEKTQYWAKIIGVHPRQIRIKEQRSRWGSCSSLGNINYNWRIIMAPPLVIDYLVIHELCHLLELNHTAKFWALVKFYQPNYELQRSWLKHHGKILNRVIDASGQP